MTPKHKQALAIESAGTENCQIRSAPESGQPRLRLKLTAIAMRYNFASHLQSIHEGNNLASNKARVYFALSGYHFDPDAITRLIGIEPTSVDASGARSPLDKPVISSWELSTETMTDDIDIFKTADTLVKKIEPAKEKILQVIKSHNLSPRIGVVVSLSSDNSNLISDFGFGARTIRFLADIGAFINVDYKVSE